MRLDGGGLSPRVDPRRGVVSSLTGAGGRLEYVADGADPPRLGDLAFSVWEDGGWREEATSRSGDVRGVELDAGAGSITVGYAGASAVPGGLRSIALRQRFRFDGDSLRWDVDVANALGAPIEVGELALAFTPNSDYRGLFAGLPATERVAGPPQRAWHERRVKQHLHISGHGSYALLQRPRGDFPALLFQPLADTALEAAYQIDPAAGDQWSDVFEGPYWLAVHSRAARQRRSWAAERDRQSGWFHGHSSLELAPGESRRLRFRFVLLHAYAELAEQARRAGKVAVHAVPGMVAPRGEQVLLQLTSDHQPTLIPEAGGVVVEAGGRQQDRWRWRLRFDTPGQKPLLVRWDGDKWTRLLFYAIPPVAETLRARARFIVERQLYRNPLDPYGRHHAFLPYDDRFESVYLDSEESWQVGAGDEYGLPIAMFLAEKNALDPDPGQVAVLEAYVDDFLLGVLQDAETLAVRSGCYWAEPRPSRRPHEWSRHDSQRTDRAFNYPLVANLYHSLYRVARRYRLTSRRGAGEYLTLAWRTALRGLETGVLHATGAPAGAHTVDLLRDLEREDPEGHRRLDERMRRFAEQVSGDPYPFGSELYVDQTAHHHVYALLRHYGFHAQADDALRVTKALRAGGQPAWFQYGNEQRGSVGCWYATADNAAALLDGFERTGDAELLRWAVAGLTSLLVPVRDSGVAHGWFTWWPDRLGFDLRSLDTDLGLYCYLKAARSVVVSDDAFGLVGYCCRVAATAEGALEVVPWDGVRKRLLVVPDGLGVSLDTGELAGARLGPDRRELLLRLEDPGGFAGRATVTIGGLPDGPYRVSAGGASRLLRAEHGSLAVDGVELAGPAAVTVTVAPA
ncbi:MAG TPA: DUF5695 domain-containing protein [Actinomycetes bacterium]|nr:DUF5695 domain-containing protein [Actinomycetes bacterium]